MYNYRLFGLNLQSPLELPELCSANFNNPDIRVTLLSVADELENPSKSRLNFDSTANAVLLRVPDVGRFLVENGSTIQIDVLKGVDAKTIRLFLLGSCMGALLLQRDFLPIHASVVATPRGAVLFCGNSGVGKSTIAATFLTQGYPILADDIAALRIKNQMVQVESAYPQVKLWENSMAHLGLNIDASSKIRADTDKRAVRMNDDFSKEASSVAGLVWLEYGTSRRPSLRALKGNDRFLAIKKNVYRRRYIVPNKKREHYASCIQFSKKFPSFLLERPINCNSINLVFDMLEELLSGHVHFEETENAAESLNSEMNK